MTEREVFNAVKAALEAKKIKEDPFEVIKLISESFQHIDYSNHKKREPVLLTFGEGEKDIFRGLFNVKPDSKEIEGELLILDYKKNGNEIVRVI